MKFRPQRGSLADAMAEVVEIAPNTESLANAMNKIYDMSATPAHAFKPEQIVVEPYGFDERIHWDTHIVTAQGRVYGFTDGPLKN